MNLTEELKKYHDLLAEKLDKTATAADYIEDFVNSDNPRFKGKSKAKRKEMALGAYYGAHPKKKVNEDRIYVIKLGDQFVQNYYSEEETPNLTSNAAEAAKYFDTAKANSAAVKFKDQTGKRAKVVPILEGELVSMPQKTKDGLEEVGEVLNVKPSSLVGKDIIRMKNRNGLSSVMSVPAGKYSVGDIVRGRKVPFSSLSAEDLLEGDAGNREPEEAGDADAYYGRAESPNKSVNGIKINLTDPAEIEAYHKGYHENKSGSKDWGEPSRKSNHFDESKELRDICKLSGLSEAKVQLNEYLTRPGEPIDEVLKLNVFQDLVEEPLIEYSPEMAASKAYQQISADLTPKAKDLQQEAIKQAEDGRTLTQVESDEIEDIWYDGSDAYDPEFCETLKDFYERQLEVVGSILYDPAEDDNFDSVPTNDESELIGAGDTGYEPDDDRDELSESKEGKCRECAPAHPWSKHLSGKGCQVPGCCCQAEPPQTESKKSFRQYLKEAEQGSKKKKS